MKYTDAVNFIEEVFNKSKEISSNHSLYSVEIFWLSPFNTLEYKLAFFNTSYDAIAYAGDQVKKLKMWGYPYYIYRDCISEFKGDLFENLEG